MKKIFLVAVCAAVIGWAGSAMALTIGTIPNGATNELLNGNIATGYYGANLFSTADQVLTFTYLGKEAAFNNYFQLFNKTTSSWDTVFTTEGSTVGASTTYNVVLGEIVQFRFLADGNTGDTAANGSNPDDFAGGSGVNFFTSFSPYTINNGDGNDLVAGMVGLWFDDAGAGPDDNHDDMLIGVTGKVAPVPEPTTMLLFGTGLLGLAAFGRRRIVTKA